MPYRTHAVPSIVSRMTDSDIVYSSFDILISMCEPPTQNIIHDGLIMQSARVQQPARNAAVRPGHGSLKPVNHPRDICAPKEAAICYNDLNIMLKVNKANPIKTRRNRSSMNKEFTIGVLGGMGTYATIHLFEQYAEIFEAEKEWDRPRMIIDNRCTMPSRVRAFLYNENVDKLVDQMADSMQRLKDAGCTRIVLACNTSHLFLPMIYEKVPGLEPLVMHIIKGCVEALSKDSVKEVYLLGTEGTIDSGVYQKALEKEGIKCSVPAQEEYTKLRDCIEAVKQNKYTDEVRETFLDLVNRAEVCILGCTELPIIYERYKDGVTCKKVYDPLEIAIRTLKEEYDASR